MISSDFEPRGASLWPIKRGRERREGQEEGWEGKGREREKVLSMRRLEEYKEGSPGTWMMMNWREGKRESAR